MPGTGPQPQPGQQNTSHTNTETANKPHLTQNGRPNQMQAPSQHKHMHPPTDKQTKSSRASQAVKQTLQRPTPTHHRGKDAGPASRRAPPKGHSMHSKHTQPSTSRPAKQKQGSQAKPSQATVLLESTPQQHHTSFHTSVGAR
ncbi:hypothetical protein ILYODFUR_034844 [Ilyodon furcidens]|uniref:Uncharacterized protein n=1 Tax=Ilyodon furcidens TaxID=33524 RepID=A0ABV0VJM0_9TELE